MEASSLMDTTSNLGINHGDLAGCPSWRGCKYARNRILNTLKGALNFLYTSRHRSKRDMESKSKILLLIETTAPHLLTLGKYILMLYLSNKAGSSSYNSACSLVYTDFASLYSSSACGKKKPYS